MFTRSYARVMALITAGAMAVTGLAAVSSAAEASSIVSTPGVTTTTVGNYPNSAAVSPDSRWLYVGSSSQGSVSVIDVHTKKLVGTIRAEGAADIAFSKTGRHAYILAGDSVEIVDTATRTVTSKVPDPIGADQLRLESGGRYLLMTRELTSEAALFDTQTNTTSVLPQTSSAFPRFFSASGADAFGLEYDSASDATTFVHTKAATGKEVARSTPWAGELNQGDVAVAADGSTAAVIRPLPAGSPSGSDRVIDVIGAATAKVLRTVRIPGGSSFRTIGVSPDGSAVIIQLGGGLTIVDSSTGAVRGTVSTSAAQPTWNYSPDGRRLFVAETGPAISGGSVDSIRLSDARVLTHVKVGREPLFALPSTTGNTVYVPNYQSETLSQVSMTTTGFRAAVSQNWGSDRYGSSVVESRRANTEQKNAAFVTSDVDPALTLGVAAVAGAGSGNQFLVIPRTGASSSALTEIQRVDPSSIYVVGDESIVSASAFAALQKRFGDIVQRIAGPDAPATLIAAEKTTEAHTAQAFSKVYVADRNSYASALLAPAAAAHDRAAYVLVDGSASTLPSSVRAFLDDRRFFPEPVSFTVMGGEKTISAGVADDLASRGTVKRISGSDRYAIAQSLNDISESAPASVIAVNGDDVVDAAMSVSVGQKIGGYLGGGVSLVHATCVPAPVVAAWKRGPAVELTLMGSPKQLGAGVSALKACS